MPYRWKKWKFRFKFDLNYDTFVIDYVKFEIVDVKFDLDYVTF